MTANDIVSSESYATSAGGDSTLEQEMRVTFDSGELSDFFGGFSPLENPLPDFESSLED